MFYDYWIGDYNCNVHQHHSCQVGFPGLLYVQVSFKSFCLNSQYPTTRYVGMIVCLLMGLISGTVYYATLAYSAAALALFLFRTLHLRVEPEVAWAAFFRLNIFSPWSGTRCGEPWKEETLASVYLGRLDLKYLLLMYHFFSSKAGSLLWCGGWHILWYRPGQTDEMIYILHSHSSQKNWQERDWSARPSHIKVITSKITYVCISMPLNVNWHVMKF